MEAAGHTDIVVFVIDSPNEPLCEHWSTTNGHYKRFFNPISYNSPMAQTVYCLLSDYDLVVPVYIVFPASRGAALHQVTCAQ